MYPETLFEAREGSDESPTTAIVRHSSSMRRIVSLELIDIADCQLHPMKLLQRMHVWRALRSACGDGFDKRLGTSHRSHTGHAALQRSAPDRLFVEVRGAAEGRIDYEGDLAFLYMVHDVRPALVDFENSLDTQSYFEQPRRCAQSGDHFKTQASQLTPQQNRRSF